MKKSIWAIGAYLFLGCIMVLMPVLFRDHYYMMAYIKWSFSEICMILFLLFAVLCSVGSFVSKMFGRKKSGKGAGMLLPDLFVLLYAISCFMTFLNSENPQAAWMGTDGWYMGTVTQFLLIGIYWAVSRGKLSMPIALGISLGGTVLPSVVAIGQRLGNDFLHLYWDMSDEVKRDYISTIGNRTWFSGYLCCVFPLAVWLFLSAGKRWAKFLAGVILFLSYSCVILTYSDSAYAALAAVLYVAGLCSLRKPETFRNWWQALLLLPWAGVLMEVLRRVSTGLVRETRGLADLFLDLRIMLPLGILLGGIVAAFAGEKGQKRLEKVHTFLGKHLKLLVLFPAVAIAAVVAMIICNTAGVLPVKLNSSLLVFDNMWGDGRGVIWPTTLKMIWEANLSTKLFGVGHDCFAWHAYSNETYAQIFRLYWGDSIMANAHNEWLNTLLCGGLLGLVAYLGIFVSMLCTILKETKTRRDTYLLGVALCIVGYVTHNFFCYQQVTAVIPMFVLLGVAAGNLRHEKI